MATQHSLYLVHGDDDYRVAEKAKEVVAALVPADRVSLGLEVVDGRAETVEEGLRVLGQCIGALQTMGFFGQGKVVWLRDARILSDSPATASEAVKTRIRELTELLRKGLTAGTILVVSVLNLDKRQAFYKLCAEVGVVQEFSAPDKPSMARADAVSRLRELVSKAGLTVSDDVAEAFLDRVGTDTRAMAGEVEKLKVYLGARREIRNADVETLTIPGREAQAWDLADSVGRRDLGGALSVLRQLVFQSKNDSAVGMLAGMESRMRELMVFREALDRGWLAEQGGYSRGGDRGGYVTWKPLPNDVEALLARCLPKDPRQTHPYRAKLLAEQARKFTLPELKRNHRRILAAYEQEVSGTGAGTTGVEILLISLLGKKRS